MLKISRTLCAFLVLLFCLENALAASLTKDDEWLMKWQQWALSMQRVYSASKDLPTNRDRMKQLTAIFQDSGDIFQSVTQLPPKFRPQNHGKLQIKILNSLQNYEKISPPCLLEECLNNAEGDRYAGLLSCHNLLKNIASLVRHKVLFTPSETEKMMKVYQRMAELRSPSSFIEDKIGPWYHGYAIAMAAYACGEKCSRLAIALEWGPYLLPKRNYFKKETRDDEKKFLDFLHHRVFAVWDIKGKGLYHNLQFPEIEVSKSGLCKVGFEQACCEISGGSWLAFRRKSYCKKL